MLFVVFHFLRVASQYGNGLFYQVTRYIFESGYRSKALSPNPSLLFLDSCLLGFPSSSLDVDKAAVERESERAPWRVMRRWRRQPTRYERSSKSSSGSIVRSLLFLSLSLSDLIPLCLYCLSRTDNSRFFFFFLEFVPCRFQSV